MAPSPVSGPVVVRVKSLFRLLLLAVLVLGAIWWFKPEWLPWSGRKQVVGATQVQELPLPPAAETSPKLYRWTDANGRVNVSDRPPADGTAYETVQYDPDVNVLPAPRPQQPEAGRED